MMSRANMGRQIATAPASRMVPTGVMPMKNGGYAKKMAKGGKVSRGDGCCMKGRTKGKMC